MAHYSAETAHNELTASSVADPIPLGMSAFAFTTAIFGCTFAGFILPGVGAGMWEFRKDNTIAATIFSSYGGFLVAFGVVFLPGFGIYQGLNGAAILHPVLGLFFLYWTIFSALLFLSSLRTNLALLIVLALMFLSYLFLTIGELAGASVVLLIIGGWLGSVEPIELICSPGRRCLLVSTGPYPRVLVAATSISLVLATWGTRSKKDRFGLSDRSFPLVWNSMAGQGEEALSPSSSYCVETIASPRWM